LPDWEWEIESRESGVESRESGVESRESGVGSRESGLELRLKSPYGWLALHVDLRPSTCQPSTTLVRAGELIYGESLVSPIMGWVSPTYGVKIPSLSFAVEVASTEMVKFTSEFTFPTDH